MPTACGWLCTSSSESHIIDVHMAVDMFLCFSAVTTFLQAARIYFVVFSLHIATHCGLNGF